MADFMKAIVYERYGPPEVLQLKEVPTPRPKDNEVLIKIHATTVTAGDWRARSLEMPSGFGLIGRAVFGVMKPRQPILGTELAGRIEAVGRVVTRFKVGDSVFAFPGSRMGCYAEYRCLSETGAVEPKPHNLTYEQAAALSFGGTTALNFLRRGALQSGERVLVNGASGSVGTAVVQLAKHFGAHVTGVCSGANIPLVTSLGADRVLDYTKDDFTRSDERYDLIVDTAGTAPLARSAPSLAEGGRLLLVLSGLTDLLKAPWVSMRGKYRVVAGPASEDPKDVRLLGELASVGKFRPVIDRQYPFEQIVDAHRYVDRGHKKGNVVINLQPA
jgi:NADPH:quinone reductase-like Zn-dependent oxidoreductase